MATAIFSYKRRRLQGLENRDLTGESVVGLKPLHVLLANYDHKVFKPTPTPTPLTTMLSKNGSGLQLIDTSNSTNIEQQDDSSPVSIVSIKLESNTG